MPAVLDEVNVTNVLYGLVAGFLTGTSLSLLTEFDHVEDKNSGRAKRILIFGFLAAFLGIALAITSTWQTNSFGIVTSVLTFLALIFFLIGILVMRKQSKNPPARVYVLLSMAAVFFIITGYTGSYGENNQIVSARLGYSIFGGVSVALGLVLTMVELGVQRNFYNLPSLILSFGFGLQGVAGAILKKD